MTILFVLAALLVWFYAVRPGAQALSDKVFLAFYVQYIVVALRARGDASSAVMDLARLAGDLPPGSSVRRSVGRVAAALRAGTAPVEAFRAEQKVASTSPLKHLWGHLGQTAEHGAGFSKPLEDVSESLLQQAQVSGAVLPYAMVVSLPLESQLLLAGLPIEAAVLGAVFTAVAVVLLLLCSLFSCALLTTFLAAALALLPATVFFWRIASRCSASRVDAVAFLTSLSAALARGSDLLTSIRSAREVVPHDSLVAAEVDCLIQEVRGESPVELPRFPYPLLLMVRQAVLLASRSHSGVREIIHTLTACIARERW